MKDIFNRKERIMRIIDKIIGRIDVSELRLKKKTEKKRKHEPSMIKDVIDNPEKFKLEAYIENDEIIVKIKRREL